MRVPLTEEMIELFNKVDRRTSNSIAFPAPRGGAMSDATLGKCMKGLHAARKKIDGKGYTLYLCRPSWRQICWDAL